jgi:hypothetical protein
MPKDADIKSKVRCIMVDGHLYISAGDLLEWFESEVFAKSSLDDKRVILKNFIVKAATSREWN